jgi:ribosomal protein L11 methyltransferase
MDHYIQYTIHTLPERAAMLTAELADLGFESFVETDTGIEAYINEPAYDEAQCQSIFDKYDIAPNHITKQVIAPQNWNAAWEADYQPIFVGNDICVRAPFHTPQTEYKHNLIIQPKNTFGTGHHDTTQLMLRLMLEENFTRKHVFDFGCGTGVLGLMALKLGADLVVGNDIDTWCTDNIEENKALNQLDAFQFLQGGLEVLTPSNSFDVILANINKNILLQSFETLSKHAFIGATLLMSGFYVDDVADLKAAAGEHGWHFVNHLSQNNWAAARFIRQ